MSIDKLNIRFNQPIYDQENIEKLKDKVNEVIDDIPVVEANPEGEATGELSKLQVGENIYSIGAGISEENYDSEITFASGSFYTPSIKTARKIGSMIFICVAISAKSTLALTTHIVQLGSHLKPINTGVYVPIVVRNSTSSAHYLTSCHFNLIGQNLYLDLIANGDFTQLSSNDVVEIFMCYPAYS